MQTDPTVNFYDDDDDTLYVDFEGALEVQMVNSETDEYMESIKGGTPEQIEQGITAIVLEMGFGYIHQIAPVLRKALLAQYDIELEEEAILRIDQQAEEILPGFMQMLQDVADEGEEE